MRKLLLSFVLMVLPFFAFAQNIMSTALSQDHWVIQASPYTYHFSYSDEHKPVRLLGAELYRGNSNFWGGDHSLWGLSYFTNSFGQPSAYGYYGGVFEKPFDSMPNVYFKWTAGILYGYKGKYKDKVPMNYGGWSPAIVPALGYRFTPQLSTQVILLGDSALMWGFSYELR